MSAPLPAARNLLIRLAGLHGTDKGHTPAHNNATPPYTLEYIGPGSRLDPDCSKFRQYCPDDKYTSPPSPQTADTCPAGPPYSENIFARWPSISRPGRPDIPPSDLPVRSRLHPCDEDPPQRLPSTYSGLRDHPALSCRRPSAAAPPWHVHTDDFPHRHHRSRSPVSHR